MFESGESWLEMYLKSTTEESQPVRPASVWWVIWGSSTSVLLAIGREQTQNMVAFGGGDELRLNHQSSKGREREEGEGKGKGWEMEAAQDKDIRPDEVLLGPVSTQIFSTWTSEKERSREIKEPTQANNADCSCYHSVFKVNWIPGFEFADSETRWWQYLDIRTSLFPRDGDSPGKCMDSVQQGLLPTCWALVLVPGRSTSTHSATRRPYLGALFQEVTPQPGSPARPTVTPHVQIPWNLGKHIHPNADNSIPLQKINIKTTSFIILMKFLLQTFLLKYNMHSENHECANQWSIIK